MQRTTEREHSAERVVPTDGMLRSGMPRMVFPEERLHPAIRDTVANHHRDIVEEVAAAIATHPIVIVGMKQNPNPRRARKLLTAKGVPFHYLEYGSYLNTWRRRTALKMWTGWPTFPMIWVKGQLIGGADDLEKLVASGELERLLAA
jgi:glutaredoxin-related protein